MQDTKTQQLMMLHIHFHRYEQLKDDYEDPKVGFASVVPA